MLSNRRSIWLLHSPLLMLVLAAAGIHAQTAAPAPSPVASPQAKTPSLEREFFKNILRDQKAIWTMPAHLRGDDAKWLVPLAAGTAALIATDRETGDAMARRHAQLEASRIISSAGSTYGTAAIAGAFYLIGRTSKNYRARETGILSAEALINSEITTRALKAITQRARPHGGKDRSKFFVGGTSFPSGHSVQAWSVATVIACEYHDHLAAQIAAYGIAGAVSVSRFTGQKHYLSDILIGSVMGYGIGRYVYRTHHREMTGSTGGEEETETQTRSRRWPSIIPEYNRRHREYGLTVAWNF